MDVLDPHRIVLPAVILICTLFTIWHFRRDKVYLNKSLVLQSADSKPSSNQLLLAQMAIGLAGIIGAKLFSLYIRDFEPFTPLSLEVTLGWRYPGGMLAVIVFAPFIIRKVLPNISIPQYLDTFALTMGIGVALWRVSCYLNGCCTGGLCDEFYCLVYPVGSEVALWQQAQDLISTGSASLAVFPLQFMFMLASLCTVVFLLFFERYKSFHGQVALLYLFIHELLKYGLEFQRVPYLPKLQYTSLLISIMALMVLLFFMLRNRAR